MSNSWMDDAAFQDVVMRNDQQANRDASRRNAAIAFEAGLGNVDALFQPKYGNGNLAPVDLGFGARLGPGAGGVNPGGVTTASSVAQQNSMLGNALLADMRLPASQRTAQIVVEDKSDPANPTFKPIFVTPKTAELFNRMEPTKGDNQRASFIYNQLNNFGAGGAKSFNLLQSPSTGLISGANNQLSK